MRPASILFALAIVLAAAPSPAGIVRPAPLAVEDGSGLRVPFDRFLAEGPAVVHLWATWCAPCLAELPELKGFLDRNPALAERVLVVSVDTAPMARVTGFLVDRLGLEGMGSLRVVAGNAGMTFGVTAYPSTVFIDGTGAVAARHAGPLDWSDEAVRLRIERHLSGVSAPQ
ncbi:TlpA family protein disulfide reductase [Acuticoccus kandeliae]|uniref:TlpA family protein disulfide reductase n=1 Tax=Acuticoccus kandeliae TaxID=2073160 RepID=UPI000D3E0668|nr:TlpA disulfide reductase family protein [Acuticoccus kandeliae]